MQDLRRMNVLCGHFEFWSTLGAELMSDFTQLQASLPKCVD
jgi:hypothetical protein